MVMKKEEEEEKTKKRHKIKEKNKLASPLIGKSMQLMKTVCAKANVRFPSQKVSHVSKTLLNYLKYPSINGPQSMDRRIHLGKNRILYYHGRFKDLTIPLNKLLAALTLNQNHLFSYMQHRSKRNQEKSRFTMEDKTLLKNVVRLTHLKRSLIPCVKIRSLC